MIIGRILALLLLTTAPLASSPATCSFAEGGCKTYVGKQLWVSIPRGNPNTVEATLTRGDWTTAATLKLKSGESFVVTGLSPASGSLDYEVRLEDGRKAWINITSGIFLVDYDPTARVKQAADECERIGRPKIGMTPAELIGSCWGKPMRIMKKTTAAGVEENYIYRLGQRVKFTDGKITEIVEAR